MYSVIPDDGERSEGGDPGSRPKFRSQMSDLRSMIFVVPLIYFVIPDDADRSEGGDPGSSP
jgi:hypothetical protein